TAGAAPGHPGEERHRRAGLIERRELFSAAMNSIPPNLAGAVALMRARRYIEAAQLLQTLLRANPLDPDGLQLLGLAYKNLGRMNEARELMARSLALNPVQPHVLNNLGSVFLRERDFGNARRCFEKALEYDPKAKDALRNLAIALRALGDLTGAEKAAREAI